MSSLRQLIGSGILSYVLPMVAGPHVLAIQKALVVLRLLSAAHANGLFGPETRDALRRFQGQNGLAPEGRLTTETTLALDRVLSGDAAPDPGELETVNAEDLEGSLGAPRVIDPSWMPNASPIRIITHWTAGHNTSSSDDRQHYHFLVEGDGKVRRGTHTVTDNDSTADGRYAAHTKGTNTKAIGISVCGMAGAHERPFVPGPQPFNPLQWQTLANLAAQLCIRYGIPVTNKTVLGHGEVQKILGRPQNGKWDPMVLPWDTSLTFAEVGDQFRQMVSAAIEGRSGPERLRHLDLDLFGERHPGGAVSHDVKIWFSLDVLTAAKGWTAVDFAEDGATLNAEDKSVFVDAFRYVDPAAGTSTTYVRATDVAEQLDLRLDFSADGATAILAGKVGGDLRPVGNKKYFTVTVARGDTLAGIARRRLGDHDRWAEILDISGHSFTEKTARTLRAGAQVLVPQEAGIPDGTAPAPAPIEGGLSKAEIDEIARGVAAITHTANSNAALTAVPIILGACLKHGVTDPAHLAYVLTTAEHETNFGRSMVENWKPTARQLTYERNGSNKKTGDGKRFRGRGYVQLTFRENYTKFARALGLDLEQKPALAAQPDIAAQVLALGMSKVGYRRPSLVLARFGFGDTFRFERARQIINADENRFEARYGAKMGVALGRKARAYYRLF